MHAVSTNFAKHQNDAILWRHKQRISNYINHHMSLHCWILEFVRGRTIKQSSRASVDILTPLTKPYWKICPWKISSDLATLLAPYIPATSDFHHDFFWKTVELNTSIFRFYALLQCITAVNLTQTTKMTEFSAPCFFNACFSIIRKLSVICFFET